MIRGLCQWRCNQEALSPSRNFAGYLQGWQEVLYSRDHLSSRAKQYIGKFSGAAASPKEVSSLHNLPQATQDTFMLSGSFVCHSHHHGRFLIDEAESKIIAKPHLDVRALVQVPI